MDLQLADKTAVVTGGSRGTGLAIVQTLLDEGMRVVTGSRRLTDELEETDAVHVAVDLATSDGATELIGEAMAQLGGIDLLVNNVGIGDTDDLVKGALLDLRELPDSAWQQTFDLHFYSALRVTRAALPSLVERKGVIVNVSSAGARVVSAGPAHYNVAKAALNALTKVMAEQFGGHGVRAVTVISRPHPHRRVDRRRRLHRPRGPRTRDHPRSVRRPDDSLPRRQHRPHQYPRGGRPTRGLPRLPQQHHRHRAPHRRRDRQAALSSPSSESYSES